MLDYFRMPHEFWNKSGDFYSKDPILGPQVYAIVRLLPYKFMRDRTESYCELKKQEVYQFMVTLA